MSKNLDHIAQEAANNFIRKSVPLNTSIKLLAERHDLNAEEVKRVVGKANTATMLHVLATGDDKKREFDLADYKLMDKLDADAASLSNSTTSFPDFRTDYDVEFDLADPDTDMPEKTAAEYIGLKDYFKWNIEKQQIAQTKVATEMKVYDTVDYMVSEFSKYKAPDFQKFANDVYSVYGPIAEPLLQSIAVGLREDIVCTKCASIIDDTTVYFKKFAELLCSMKSLIALNSREEIVHNNIRGFVNANF